MANQKIVAEVDLMELACRIAEAVMGIKRPDGATAKKAMDTLEAIDPGQLERYLAAALAAAEFVGSCVKSGGTLQ